MFRIRISLRTLIILVTAVGVCFAFVGHRIHRGRIQCAAVRCGEHVADFRYDATYKNDDSTYPQWLIEIFGIDFFVNVTHIELKGSDFERLDAMLSLGNIESFMCREDFDVNRLRNCRNLKHFQAWREGPFDLAVFSELTKLQSLVLNRSGIVTDLSPLSKLTQLNSLDLDLGFETDLSPLANLINMEVLSLNWRASATTVDRMKQPLDLGFLLSMPKLRKVDFHGAEYQDLDGLVNASSLEEVYIDGNGLANLNGIANATKLTTLSVACDSLTDISGLADKRKLFMLDIYSDSLSDISPLATADHVLYLVLDVPSATNLTPLRECLGLERLTVRANSSDSSWISKLIYTDSIDLKGCAVDDLSIFEPITNLRFLSLEGTIVSDLRPLQKFKHLENLDIIGSNVVDASCLGEMQYLDCITITDSPLRVAPKSTSTRLWHAEFENTLLSDESDIPEASCLNLSGTKITNLNFAKGGSFEKLKFANTRVSELSPLANTRINTELDLSGTLVTDLSPLATQRDGIRYIYICDTKITDLKPLARSKIETIFVSEDFPQSAIDELKSHQPSFTVARNSSPIKE